MLQKMRDAINMNLGKPWECGDTGHLACCSPWEGKELHTTGQLNNNTGMCQIELEQKRMSSKGDRGVFCFCFFSFSLRFGSHFHD